MKETTNERAVEAVSQIIESAIQRHGVPLDELSGTIDDAIAALAAARPFIMEEAWQPIETAPVDEHILAAVEVVNNKTGASWWERHTIVIDSETGEIHPDNDAGWGIADYTHWQPLPAAPRTAGSKTDD